MMKWRAHLAAILISGLAVASPARSDTYHFNFTASNGTVLSAGLMTTGGPANTLYNGSAGHTVTGLTGTFLGQNIHYTPPSNPPELVNVGVFIGDDQLVDSDLKLNEAGLVFTTDAYRNGINLLGSRYFFSDFPYAAFADPSDDPDGHHFLQWEGIFSITPAAAPEPATWAAMTIGFLVSGAALRSRRKSGRLDSAALNFQARSRSSSLRLIGRP